MLVVLASVMQVVRIINHQQDFESYRGELMAKVENISSRLCAEFSSRWSGKALHPVPQKFPPTVLKKVPNVRLTDDGPLWCFQKDRLALPLFVPLSSRRSMV